MDDDAVALFEHRVEGLGEVLLAGHPDGGVEVGVEVDDRSLLASAHARHAQHARIGSHLEEACHLGGGLFPAYVQLVVLDRDAQRLHLL